MGLIRLDLCRNQREALVNTLMDMSRLQKRRDFCLVEGLLFYREGEAC
jgi:hypothetical protein